jgi:malonate-semialdehyde dehydrogenase (acetylating) / methylmalonate-semialdehyde dehydrogenase
VILAELCGDAGMPDGVANVVHGAAKTVDFLPDEPAIKAISFVGSNCAGEYILRAVRPAVNGCRLTWARRTMLRSCRMPTGIML